MPTLVSYNTSYVNDCHLSQFNGFMSESTSILAKAIKIYNSKHTDFPIKLEYEKRDKPKPPVPPKPVHPDKEVTEQQKSEHKVQTEIYEKNLNLYFESINVDTKITEDYTRLISEPEIGNYLENLRIRMSVRNTNYLNFLIENKVDFISLIEQIAHVGPDNHAYYDMFLNNKLDLGEDQNDKYGILYRLKQMPSVEDIDEPDRRKNPTYKYTYACVYDTIVNCQGQMPKNPIYLSSVAEGISIIYKKSIFGRTPVLAVWKNTSSESVKKLKKLNHEQKIIERNVHYYSDDSGLSICYTDGDLDKPLKFVTNRGTADGGRPIIMTAGFNSETKSLIILVAIHGPNIPNLFAAGTNLNDSKNQLKNRFDSEIDALFDQVRTSISNFINSGIDLIDNKTDFENTDIQKVEVYLGGDFNDARGLILKSLINRKKKEKKEEFSDENSDNQTSGLNLNFKLGEYRAKPVIFSGYQDLTKLDNINEPTDPIKQTQGRYKSLYSCCANGDSLNYEKRLDGEKLNTQGNGVFDKMHLYDLSTFSPSMKTQEFVDPQNFGYNGDYALYGTNSTDFINTLQYMVLDKNPILKVNGLVYSSDHLPVISSTDRIPFSRGGRRRRRYSMRVLKRHTKKGLPKKIRASRRKRRVCTYKKH